MKENLMIMVNDEKIGLCVILAIYSLVSLIECAIRLHVKNWSMYIILYILKSKMCPKFSTILISEVKR